MQLTTEQQNIIASNCNIKINAIAGSGKTTTIIAYAKAKATGKRILYIAFNKSVKLEAAIKFKEQGLHHVHIETAHSLAFKHVVVGSKFVLKQEYQSYELAKLLNINLNIPEYELYVLCNHVLKFTAYFCNSSVSKIAELNYLDVVQELKTKAYVKLYYTFIEK